MSVAASRWQAAMPNAVPAVSAIVCRNGRYLLVRRANPPAQDLYAFPGGRVEAGESIAEAALRELAEETGLIGHDPQPHSSHDLVAVDADGRVTHRFILTALIVPVAGDDEAVAGDDARAAGWFSASEIEQLDVPDSVRACIGSLEHDRILTAFSESAEAEARDRGTAARRLNSDGKGQE